MLDFTVIILGSDENAYGNSRLIYEEYKIKPILMCSKQLMPTRFSKILTIYQVDNFDKNNVFVFALKEKLTELRKKYKKVIVIPCADYYTELLVSNYDKFDNMIANKFISRELLYSFYSKAKFYELCEKHGLPYPKTLVLDKKNWISGIEKISFDYPIIMKPENSNSYEYLHSEFEGKKKVYYFASKEEYLSLIKSMQKSSYSGKIILQEFIEGDDTTDRVINAYCDENSNVLVSCLGQPIMEEYAPKMLGNYASIITRYDKVLYDKVANFLKDISYVGFANIDLKYDKKNDRYVAFELNPRLGRSSFFVRSANINMMKYIIDDVVYNKKQDVLFNKNIALWQNVNKKTILNFVSDPKIINEVKNLIKNKKNIFTLKYNKDFSIKRMLLVKRYYKIQDKNIDKYFFKKILF